MKLLSMLLRTLTAPFVRYEVRGGAHVADIEPGWIASCNHRSVFDFAHTVVSLDHFDLSAHVMVAERFFESGTFRPFLNFIDAIPVYRTTDPKAALRSAIETINDRRNIGIMPEGTIKYNPEDPATLGTFKTGVIRIAKQTGVPIVPLAMAGGERIWPDKTKPPKLRWFRRRPVIFVVSDDVFVPGNGDLASEAARLRDVHQQLFNQAVRELRAVDPTYLAGVELPDHTASP